MSCQFNKFLYILFAFLLKYVDSNEPLINYYDSIYENSNRNLRHSKHFPIHNETLARSRIQLNKVQVVDGLKNSDIVVFISTTSRLNGRWIRERIIPSARTWMKLLHNIFVVIEDSVDSRFLLRHCYIQEYERFTTFKCPHEPIYVLARACTDQYFAAEGICCKLDQSIEFLVYAKPELFARTKYLLQSDDDTYWRVDQLLRWLAAVDKAGYDKIPIIANGSPSISDSTYGVYRVEDGCKEIFTNGWYQPFMMNHAGIARIANSTRQLAITQTCKAFQCSQDLGVGIFAWLYEFYHIYLPGFQMNPQHTGVSILKPDYLVIHAVRHLRWDDCDAETWPSNLKYNQHMIVGCGTIEKSSPTHDKFKTMNMYDLWNYYLVNGSDIGVRINDDDEPLIEWVSSNDPSLNDTLVPRVRFLDGYNTTMHSKIYNITNDWVPFTVNDCTIPGKIKV